MKEISCVNTCLYESKKSHLEKVSPHCVVSVGTGVISGTLEEEVVV